MEMTEWIACVICLVLALYGCSQLIRRFCLWATDCSRSMRYVHLAIPTNREAVEPLFRCLQAQSVWWERSKSHCPTFVLLPEEIDLSDEWIERLEKENPAVHPITVSQLTEWAVETRI